MPEVLPVFALYGEPPCDDVEEHYLHIESIAERSRIHDWNIRPHLHRDLHHLMLVTRGKGLFHGEQASCSFASPALIRVPKQYVHGFEFSPQTNGWVVTVSDFLLQRIAQEHAELDALTNDATTIALSRQCSVARHLHRSFGEIEYEFRGNAPARRTAIHAALLTALVAVLRLEGADAKPRVLSNNADAQLVARFQGFLELQFKTPLRIEEYASRLAVSRERLRLACKRITGYSPVQLLLRRRMLEAKRSLLYTSMTITQVAEFCGFGDPAYFSRQFHRFTGAAPRAYRARRSDQLDRHGSTPLRDGWFQ